MHLSDRPEYIPSHRNLPDEPIGTYVVVPTLVVHWFGDKCVKRGYTRSLNALRLSGPITGRLCHKARSEMEDALETLDRNGSASATPYMSDIPGISNNEMLREDPHSDFLMSVT